MKNFNFKKIVQEDKKHPFTEKEEDIFLKRAFDFCMIKGDTDKNKPSLPFKEMNLESIDVFEATKGIYKLCIVFKEPCGDSSNYYLINFTEEEGNLNDEQFQNFLIETKNDVEANLKRRKDLMDKAYDIFCQDLAKKYNISLPTDQIIKFCKEYDNFRMYNSFESFK